MLSFFSRWPGWAIGAGVAVLAVGVVAYGGYSLASRPHVTVASGAQHCGNPPSRLASLFSDGQTTMIRLSNLDYSNLQVLRTEPANVLPGMFESLLSLSGDSSRLAYVTADDELLDNAHVVYIDPINPANRIDLATVPKGFWTVQPEWSADGKKLAYVTLDQSGGAPGQFELWVADTTMQPATVGIQGDLVADNFTNGHSAAICWTSTGHVVIIPSTPLTLPSPSPTPHASPVTSSSPSTGSPCGVPIMSQNDPAWRSTVMKSQSDTIGGAGCALTSAAMLLNYYGSTMTPADLNTCLAGDADPLAWKSIPACTKGLVSGGDRIDFSWTDLDALLSAGRPAIVGMLGGQNGSHFVVVTQGGGGVADSYRITDPWDATTHKTLGGYINDGYNPAWIISFTGPGRNCARLIKGVTPALPTVPNGSSTKDPVKVDVNPALKKYVKFLGIHKVSDGSIKKDTFNLPAPFTKIDPGTTITDEGIYQVLVTTQAPSQPPRYQLYKFTIDQTPPAVDLSLLNPRASSFHLQTRQPDSAPVAFPLLDRPGKIQVKSSDTLSGLKDIKYSLDGAALTDYSSANTFNRVLSVDSCFDHSFKIQAVDAAGNTTEVTKNFTVYCYVAPTPPPPPPCSGVALSQASVSMTFDHASYKWTTTFTWSGSGNCAPFHGMAAGVFTYPGGGQNPLPAHSVGTPSGSLQDTGNCGNFPPGAPTTISYTITLSDAAGHSSSKSASTTVPQGC